MKQFYEVENIQHIRFTYSASANKALDRSDLMAFCVGGDIYDAESD